MSCKRGCILQAAKYSSTEFTRHSLKWTARKGDQCEPKPSKRINQYQHLNNHIHFGNAQPAHYRKNVESSFSLVVSLLFGPAALSNVLCSSVLLPTHFARAVGIPEVFVFEITQMLTNSQLFRRSCIAEQ